MTIKQKGGNQNEDYEVVRFGKILESRGIRSSSEPSEIGIEALVESKGFINQKQETDGTYVIRSNIDLKGLIARLQEENYTDSRTDLPNYKFFKEKLIEYIGLARRSHERNETPDRETFSLVFFDFNDFKKYNDQYGHPAADRKVKEVADISQKYARRSTDHICRYGGDEFALILWEINKRDADAIACGMREEVLKKTGVSLSYGIANYASDVDDKNYTRQISEVAYDLVTFADKRMQKEKTKYKALETSILGKEYQEAA